MLLRNLRGAIAIAALLASMAAARAFDDAKYPAFSGLWRGVNLGVGGQAAFDPTKPWGRAQQAPLTPEYQAVFEASLADQANGGQGNWPSGIRCMPAGMPTVMNIYGEMEIVVLPEITHILLNHNTDVHRRIYTDGRDWPEKAEPTYQGYSIGRWIDSESSGRYEMLEVETRNFKGPRALDPSGLPTHADNQSIVRERFFLDKANSTRLHDEITLIDHAFTRPWTVLKNYRRVTTKIPRAHRAGLRQRERQYADRQGALLSRRRPRAHAHAPEPAAARPEIFQSAAAVVRHSNAAQREDGVANGERKQHECPLATGPDHRLWR